MGLSTAPRALTDDERSLAKWMLENGHAHAAAFLPQLDKAQVRPWRCPCGCASINFQIDGQAPPPSAMNVLGDFVFGKIDAPAGAFIFECGGLLAGIEVYDLVADAPSTLPMPPLRPYA